jgi:hypothetical protein
MLSLEAALTAMRLDPTLLPPSGSLVSVIVPNSVTGQSDLEVDRGLVVSFGFEWVFGDKVANVTIVSGAVEIVYSLYIGRRVDLLELPDFYSPISDWPRIPY